MSRTLRVGARGSRLSMWQLHHAVEELESRGVSVGLVVLVSSGDRHLPDVRAVLVFRIPAHKDSIGSSAAKADGIVPSAVRRIRHPHPGLLVITDVARRLTSARS